MDQGTPRPCIKYMKITVTPLNNINQTLTEMKRIARQYAADMAPYASLNLSEIHELVKNIPYRKDPPGVETVKRPYYTLHRLGPGGDCDDKAVVIAAWALLNKFPVKFVCSGRWAKKPLHHVYAQVYINGSWIKVDATYNFNVLGRSLFVERRRTEHEI